MQTHIYAHTCINMHTYTHVCTNTHAHTYTQAHMCTHTHICIYIYHVWGKGREGLGKGRERTGEDRKEERGEGSMDFVSRQETWKSCCGLGIPCGRHRKLKHSF